MQLTRRALLAVSGAALAVPATTASSLEYGSPKQFDWDGLGQSSRELATKAYAQPRPVAPDILAQLDYGPHADIVQPVETGLYANGPGTCPVTFFHLGRLFPYPVRINSLVNGIAREVEYRKTLFRFPSDNPAAKMPEKAGFAGFRVHDPRKADGTLDAQDWLAFLGASYFRSRGDLGRWGASARGISINPANPQPPYAEEFPLFREFWIEPFDSGGSGRIYALLDGPSATGAYRFDVRLYPEIVTEIHCTLQLRHDVARFGIAPLTSMFFYGEINRFFGGDWRNAVHDSDGLAIWNGAGEQLWRPLTNPPGVIVSSFSDDGPKGFGLLQRSRMFEDFEDGENHFERRPNVWVEPISDWGLGSVELLEIPTKSEFQDNVVAFWVPREAASAGKTYSFAYRLHWSGREHFPPGLARCAATRMSPPWVTDASGFEQARHVVIDFVGDLLAKFEPSDCRIELSFGGSGGIMEQSLQRAPQRNSDRWRVLLTIGTSGKLPVEARLLLRKRDAPVSETWLSQFHPLTNAG